MTESERIREVEIKLKGWRKLQDRVKEAENDAAAIAFSGGSAGGAVQSSNIADKTYRGAEMLAAVEKDRAWEETINEAMDYMRRESPDLYNLLRGHYGMLYRRGYRKSHAALFEKSYRNSHFIGHTTYHRWRHDGLKVIADIALQNGLQYVTRSYQRKKS